MYYAKNPYQYEDRFFPAVPFLVGALAGGAAIGLTRPRPVYVNPAYSNPMYNQMMPYGGSSYYYYYPRPF